MDKKNFILGMLCLMGAFALFVVQGQRMREVAAQNNAGSTLTTENAAGASPVSESLTPSSQPLPENILQWPTLTHHPDQCIVLENAVMRVRFSTLGGGIHSIDLKQFPNSHGDPAPYTFNNAIPWPALTLAFDPQHLITVPFEITTRTDSFIQFHATLEDGTDIIRGYQLPSASAKNPYLIQTECAIRQEAESSKRHSSVWMLLGAMPETASDKYQEYLNFCANDGKDTEFQRIAEFEASNGFLGIGKHPAHPYLEAHKPLVWGALKNQFFAAILTPATPAIGYRSFPRSTEGKAHMQGLLQMAIPTDNTPIKCTYYVGPKQYLLLEKMGQNQDDLMQFGFFSVISKVLLMSMHAIHAVVPNWGWVILILTLIIKLLMWPITQMQLNSSKKMSSIQEPLKKIREKYKNDPQRLQKETMKLFKENRINPAAGCLPLLLQIPIFIGLYCVLRSASEIRFQPFLWIKDLSVPDTVGMLGNFPINIMPLIMGVTMIIQMKMTPTPSVDGGQQKILLLMPLIFLFFCYNFPAALVLYWTAQNVLTIAQQCITNRHKKPIPSAN